VVFDQGVEGESVVRETERERERESGSVSSDGNRVRDDAFSYFRTLAPPVSSPPSSLPPSSPRRRRRRRRARPSGSPRSGCASRYSEITSRVGRGYELIANTWWTRNARTPARAVRRVESRSRSPLGFYSASRSLSHEGLLLRAPLTDHSCQWLRSSAVARKR